MVNNNTALKNNDKETLVAKVTKGAGKVVSDVVTKAGPAVLVELARALCAAAGLKLADEVMADEDAVETTATKEAPKQIEAPKKAVAAPKAEAKKAAPAKEEAAEEKPKRHRATREEMAARAAAGLPKRLPKELVGKPVEEIAEKVAKPAATKKAEKVEEPKTPAKAPAKFGAKKEAPKAAPKFIDGIKVGDIIILTDLSDEAKYKLKITEVEAGANLVHGVAAAEQVGDEMVPSLESDDFDTFADQPQPFEVAEDGSNVEVAAKKVASKSKK